MEQLSVSGNRSISVFYRGGEYNQRLGAPKMLQLTDKVAER
jgi:hypothetical protein